MEEANGVQSWPKSAKPEVLSENLRSMRAQASRIDGALDLMLDAFRLFARAKSPSKSNSNFPVITVFGAGSSHSKFAPMRNPRALM